MASSCYARARHAEQRLAPDAPRVKDDEATETSPAWHLGYVDVTAPGQALVDQR
jgi:hypothetical protein